MSLCLFSCCPLLFALVIDFVYILFSCVCVFSLLVIVFQIGCVFGYVICFVIDCISRYVWCLCQCSCHCVCSPFVCSVVLFVC